MPQKRIKIAVIVLSVLLTFSLASLIGILIHRVVTAAPTTAVVSDNIVTPEADDSSLQSAQNSNKENSSSQSQSVSGETNNSQSQNHGKAISLHKRNAGDNTPFKAGNMLPGDSETKNYCVRVSHKKDVVLRFRADIRSGCEILSEVLCCRVTLSDSGEVLYDGLMRDIPESLNRSLNTDKSTTSEVAYEITAYLDTSVGNEYMNKDLIADFRWWVEETDNLDSPQTGDGFNIILHTAIAVGSLLLIILLLKKRQKEEADNEQ